MEKFYLRMKKMKSSLAKAILLPFMFLVMFGQLAKAVNETKTVGTTGADYATLSAAFSAINDGTLKGAITLQIIDNVNESTNTATLYQSGFASSSSYTSVLIYPTVSGKTISGTPNAPLIELNGADNVTIDGRLYTAGLPGATPVLTIKNTKSNSPSLASTIKFINDATNNKIKYCNIQGSSMDPTGGILFFNTGFSSTTGNNGNKIDHNNITNAGGNRAINTIYVNTGFGVYDSEDTISNNNFYDFFQLGSNSICLNIKGGTRNWTISGNSFYETTTMTPAGNSGFTVISIYSSGNNFAVNDNYIGGSSNNCGGTWMKPAGNSTYNSFTAIKVDLSISSSAGTSNIQGNKIKNFSWTNVGNGAAGTHDWNGIISTGYDTINIGTTAENIIGATTGTTSIALTNSTSGGTFYGIKLDGSGKMDCQNNRIGLITVANSSAGNSTNFKGISKSPSTGTATISNNTIGSTSIASGITATSASSGFGVTQTVYGIYAEGTRVQTIASNTIAGLNNATTNTAGSVAGIYYKGNVTGGTLSVSQNFIYGLTASGSESTAAVYGIQIVSGKTIYSNNIISLGGNTPSTIYGIYENGDPGNDNDLYFNTVYIGGTPTSGYFSTYALYSAYALNLRNFRNNIFYNARSNYNNTLSGKHYAAYFNTYGAQGGLTIDYNDYYAPGILGGTLGYFPWTDRTTLADWKTATEQDIHSLNIDPSFADAGGPTPAGYKPSAAVSATLAGVTVTGITTDYPGVTRESVPTIGAYEVIPVPVTTQAVTSITNLTATGNGTIAINASYTNRGCIVYEYSNTDKIIGNSGVVNFAEPGSFGLGSFTAAITGLSVATRYNLRAHATKNTTTSYGERVAFWTMANVPDAPTVNNPTATTLDVIVNVNSNPTSTEFAIYETSTIMYLQANGTFGASAVWQTATAWGTKTVTGLTTGTEYTFQVIARNGDSTETAYGATTNGIPVDKPTVTTQVVSSIDTTFATGNGNITLTNGIAPTARGTIYYAYTNTDKAIGDAGVTNVSTAGSFSTGAFTSSLTGLAVSTHYNTIAYATNTVGTGYGSRVAFWTLANVPDAPTVNNPTATTLDIIVNVNSNPTSTEFAIYETSTIMFLQANGTFGASAVWQTAAAWGTKTVTALTTGTEYTFQVKARNGDNIETDYGPAASGTPVDHPYVAWQPGSVWSETQPAGNNNKSWAATATSANGLVKLVATSPGRIYLSVNGATTWNETRPAGDVNYWWQTVSVSSDGLTLLAAVQLGRLYKSIDGGTSWSETQPAGNVDKEWSSVSVSNNGSTMLAAVMSGRLYISTNSGANWSETQPDGAQNKPWNNVSVSSDGLQMLASAGTTRVYRSANGGTNWTVTYPTGFVEIKNWTLASVSGNGLTMLAGVAGGRLYKSANSGTNWVEVRPAGDADKNWVSLSVSSDGLTILAAVQLGRLYKSIDGGTSWNETQPAGAFDRQWMSVSVSGDGTTLLAGEGAGRLYNLNAAIFNPITATTASATGKITATNGANASNRGAIIYPYTGTDKIIGDADVTNVSNPGDFGIGTYPVSFTGLTPGARYNARAHATNTYGTGYSDRGDFWTLANVPAAPTVDNPTATTLDVTVNVNGNSSLTEFAIHETTQNKFIQAGGTLGATADWQTATAWGTKTVTSLTTGSTYTFEVKARNGDPAETAYSQTASGIPVDHPYVAWQPASVWSETQPVGNVDKYWYYASQSSNGMIKLAAPDNGRLYLSINGGTTWSETQPAGNANIIWRCISVSGDGSKMIAGTNGGRLYISTNNGVSWTDTQAAGNVDKFWYKCSVSNDGSTMLACVNGGRLYLSVNGGVAWVETQPAGNVDYWWSAVSVSGDGLTMMAGGGSGRLYRSTNHGGSWNETQPAGSADKNWGSISISDNGSIILAAIINNNKIYKSVNGGGTWVETQFAGSPQWQSVSMSGDGLTMLAAASYGSLFRSVNGGTSWTIANPTGVPTNTFWKIVSISGNGLSNLAGIDGGRLYRFSMANFTDITSTSASATGNITGTNGANATSRGAIIYPYTNTDKIIGDANVTNVSNPGDFGIGTYPVSFTGLTPGARYNARAHATNTYGTGYSDRGDFWTLANVPAAPTVDNPTATTLDVTVNVNGNSSLTEFAIHETTQNKFIQADGTLGATVAWQTATAWGIKTVTSLTTGSTYTFKVKARNGDNAETVYSATASGIPVAKPLVTTQAATSITSITATANGNITVTGATNPSARGTIWYAYSNTDKVIGDAGVTDVSEAGSFATGAFTSSLTGLAVNTQYNAIAYAINTIGTGYGARVAFWTLANVPDAPTVNNATATTLDIAVNVNSNPSTTEFCINETSTTYYLQANGTLGGSAVWQTATAWGTKTITGLTTGSTYTFQVKARNGSSTETSYSATASGIPVYKPTVTTQAATSLAVASATGNGNITAINGIAPTARGTIWYAYSNTDKVIGDAGVTDVSEAGSFATGAFTSSLTGLAVNTQYNAIAYAINTIGTGYGARVAFWTLANVPDAPTVNNATATTLDIAVNVNSNPTTTEFAIYETSTPLYVQADGSLGASAVWQTATAWGTKTVTGLTTGATYTFEVKARNGANVETAFGASTSGTTCSNPTDGGSISGAQTICSGLTPQPIANTTLPAGHSGTLEYKWQSSTTSAATGFTDIALATSSTYTPGLLNTTTWLKRFARVDCKTNWVGSAVSNVIEITINPAPTPVITGTPKDGYYVHSFDTITYCTPFIAGHLYSWSAFGNVTFNSLTQRNCIIDIFVNPCGVYGSWSIIVTETDPVTGCSTKFTKNIYIETN
ncbi:MAG: beta strand repeat-containing protein [Bacteroidales bacterium]